MLRISTKIWKEIRRDYETTDTTYPKLAKKYGYAKDSIGRRSRKENWIKYSKGIKEIQKSAYEVFAEESATSALDLIKIEDESLARIQKEIDADIPFHEIIQAIQSLNGKVNIKMDGTIKGVAEASIIIGRRRMELRGQLSPKEQELLNLEKLKYLDKKKMEEEKLETLRLDNEAKRQDLAIKEATYKKLLRKGGYYGDTEDVS